MKISFIIPIYKVEKYLHQCVQSILSQVYQNIEIVLVDDGSPDKSPEICDDYAKKDSRIKVIHKENGGLSDARNVGLRAATGDYVVFLDSDDWWCDNNALVDVVEKLEKTQADVLIFKSKKYYQLLDSYEPILHTSGKSFTGEVVDIETLMRNSIFVACAWDKIVRRSILIDNDICFVVGQLSEDIEWCCKLLSLDLNYTYFDRIIHVYRQQNNLSITSNITNKNLEDIQNVITKWADLANTIHNIPICHFLALEMVLWCAISDKATGENGMKIIKEMSLNFYLIKYNWYPRVLFASRFRWLGYSLFRRFVYIGYNVRKLKMKLSMNKAR